MKRISFVLIHIPKFELILPKPEISTILDKAGKLSCILHLQLQRQCKTFDGIARLVVTISGVRPVSTQEFSEN